MFGIKSLLNCIRFPENKSIMIIGGPDTGKTTLLRNLLDYFSGLKVGILDSDMGQSHIGPPTTIAWAMCYKEFKDWDSLLLKDIYFIEGLSPTADLLATLTGTKLLYEKAKRKVNKLFIDTTGFVKSPLGIYLKSNKISLLKPDVLVFLQRDDELKPLIEKFKYRKDIKSFILKPPKSVILKSHTQRKIYRRRKFQLYLQRATLLSFFRGTRLSFSSSKKMDLIDRIVSLRNPKGEDMCIGLIKEANIFKNKLKVLAPPPREEVAEIFISKLKIKDI